MEISVSFDVSRLSAMPASVSPPLATRSKKSKSCSCLTTAKMLLAALPSIVFGVFTILFTLQQQQASEKNREQDQKQTDERNIKSTYENYISDISALLLDRKFNRSNPDHLLHIRVKTLSVLLYVDAQRKRDVISFLYESHLIRSDRPEYARLNLRGADLSDVQFIGTSANEYELHHLYLPGVQAPKIMFHWCQLNNAVFDGASMPNGQFIYCNIPNASFRGIYAPDLLMGDMIFMNNSIRDSIVHRFRLLGAYDVFDRLDLSNIDMLNTNQDRSGSPSRDMLTSPKINICNTRLPDGSFGPIDNSDLVKDGGGELVCQEISNRTDWGTRSPTLMIISSLPSYENGSGLADLGNCSFLSQSAGVSVIQQNINVPHFSVLIDSGEARYNLSITIGCVADPSNNITVYTIFYKDNFLLISADQVISKTDEPEKYHSLTGKIPKDTSNIVLTIMAHTSNSSGFCFADNIKMNIFHDLSP